MERDVRKLLFIIVLGILPTIAMALELSPLSNKPYTGDLGTLKKQGVIRVLVSADLGFYYIEGGKPKGIVAWFIWVH